MADTLDSILRKAVREAIDEQKGVLQNLYEETAALVQKQSQLQEKLAEVGLQIESRQAEIKAIDVLLDQLSAERDSLQAKPKE